ncbi:MAG: hypothetical protein U5R14_07595 [Gemmatimonadota bacterium]|nr:hypothetical protein [Gemmatimonadota bacterium]
MSNQARLSVVVFLALLPFVGLYWYAEHSLRAVHRAHQEAELLHQVGRIGLMYNRTLAQSEMLLGALSEMSEFESPRQPRCDQVLSSVMGHLTYYTGIQFIDVDGFVSCGSLAGYGDLFVNDRYYHRGALANRQFTIGNFVMGRITGKPVVGLAYPIEAAGSSEATGVLALYFDLDELANRAYELGMPQAATFTVVDRSGTVMVRVPARQVGPDTVGATVPASFPVPTSASGDPYLARGVDLDGVERHFAVQPLQAGTSRSYGHVYFGVEDDVVFEGGTLEPIGRLRMLALAGLLVIGGAWLFGVKTIAERESAAT